MPRAEEEGILNSNCPKNMQSTLCRFNGIFVFFKRKKNRTSKQNLRPKGFGLADLLVHVKDYEGNSALCTSDIRNIFQKHVNGAG